MNRPEDVGEGSEARTLPAELNSKRLVLRRFCIQDAPTIEKLLNDREIASNTRTIDFPFPQGAAEKLIQRQDERWETGDSFVFAIVKNEDKQLIGGVSLEVNKSDHNAELGYWVGREFWNQGFSTEAARLAVKFGFEHLGLFKITAHHLTRNPASGRVLEKIGMTREGLLRSHVRKWGVFEDIVLYGMLASDPR